MTAKRQVVWASLGTFGSATVIIGIGILAAGAQQRGSRPYIPRASEVRPISRSQPPAVLPSPSAVKSASERVPAAQSKSGADQPKQGGLDSADLFVDEQTGIVTGKNFTYTENDMVVTGAKARYNKNTKVLDAEGSLTMDNPKHHVTGDIAHVETKKSVKHAVFNGNVVIVIKPKETTPGSTDNVASEKGKGGTITCDHVDDYYGRNFVIMNGHLTFKQKITKKNGKVVERTLTAEHAEFDENANNLHLFPPVDMKDTENQEAHFTKDVYIGTKEGEETLKSESGKFVFNIDQDEDESDSANGAKPDDKTGPISSGTPGAGKETPGAGKQDTPVTTPDKKQDPPASPPDKKQDPPVKKT
jgi:hypothetical protein